MTLRKLTWDGGYYTYRDIAMPTGGDQCPMGSLGMQETGTYGTPTHYEVPATVWGDYVGGGVERSNYRSLVRDYPETFVEVYGDYGSHYLAISIADFCFMGTTKSQELLTIFKGLEYNYPLYDEEDHSMLEMEELEEQWDQWIKQDIMWDITKNGGEFTDDEEAHLEEWFYEWLSEASEYPYLESATTIVVPGVEDFTSIMAWYIGGIES